MMPSPFITRAPNLFVPYLELLSALSQTEKWSGCCGVPRRPDSSVDEGTALILPDLTSVA